MKPIHSIVGALGVLFASISVGAVHTCPNPERVLEVVKNPDYKRGQSILVHQGLAFKVNHEIKVDQENKLAFSMLYSTSQKYVGCTYTGAHGSMIIASIVAENITAPAKCDASIGACKFEIN